MDAYGPKDALTLLITVEGLLFAALSIGVASARKKLGEVQGPGAFILSLAAFVVIALVAVGAWSAWSDIYEAKAGVPEATNLEIEGIALAVAIVAQPIFAFVIALFARTG
ncbi:MAG: hypothetical protein ACLQBY_02605 [Solirubrobacteraceae bacterium]